MADALIHSTTELLRKDFELRPLDEQRLSEAEVIQLLADEIDRLMQTRLEWLLSKLYTMDVGEADVSAAMHPASPIPANLALAKLVYQRQRRRAYTKAHFKPQPLDDEDLAW
ncbi:MAG: hypothetical protein AAFQ37_01545 [Bacteroidota bacterium]